jgi:hypothetical protein
VKLKGISLGMEFLDDFQQSNSRGRKENFFLNGGGEVGIYSQRKGQNGSFEPLEVRFKGSPKYLTLSQQYSAEKSLKDPQDAPPHSLELGQQVPGVSPGACIKAIQAPGLSPGAWNRGIQAPGWRDSTKFQTSRGHSGCYRTPFCAWFEALESLSSLLSNPSGLNPI